MDKRKEDTHLAVLVSLLIASGVAALVYFGVLPSTACAITVLYLALVAGLFLLVRGVRDRSSPEAIGPHQAAHLAADLEKKVDAAWRELNSAAPPAIQRAEPYQPHYEFAALYRAQALSALEKCRGTTDRGAIREWPLALAPLILPPCIELGQRALGRARRPQATQCLEQAKSRLDRLVEEGRRIDNLGRQEKADIQKLLGRVQALLATRKRWAPIGRPADSMVAQIRAAEQTLKSLLQGSMRADNPRKEAVVAAHSERQKIQRVLDDIDRYLARQITPQQYGAVSLMEQRKYLGEVEIVLDDLDRRGGPCQGWRARTQALKKRLDEQEFSLETQRVAHGLGELSALDEETSQLRGQVFWLRDNRRAAQDVYLKNQQHVEQELGWIVAAEGKGYVLDQTRPVIDDALDWLGKLRQLLATEDLDALKRLDSIDQEIGGRIADIRTLGATFDLHRNEYEQARRAMKLSQVAESFRLAKGLADALDPVHERYRQGVPPDALRRLSDAVRDSLLELDSEITRPNESRLGYLAGRLRRIQGNLEGLDQLQQQVQQNLDRRRIEQTEARRKLDELDAMFGALQSRGADQDDGVAPEFAKWNAQRESLRASLDQPATNYAEVNAVAIGLVNEVRNRFGAYADEHERVKADLKALQAQLKAGRLGLLDAGQRSLVYFEDRVTQSSNRVDTWLHRYEEGSRQNRPLTALRALLTDGQSLDEVIRGVRADIEREDALLEASRDRADAKWQAAQWALLEFRQDVLSSREWNGERWYADDLAQLRGDLDDVGRRFAGSVTPFKRRTPAEIHSAFDQIDQALARVSETARRQTIEARQELGELKSHQERLEAALDWYGSQARRQPSLMAQWTAMRQDVMESLQLSCQAARQASDVRAALILALEQVNDFGRRAGLTPPPL